MSCRTALGQGIPSAEVVFQIRTIVRADSTKQVASAAGEGVAVAPMIRDQLKWV